MALTFPAAPLNGDRYVSDDDATYVYSSVRGAWVLEVGVTSTEIRDATVALVDLNPALAAMLPAAGAATPLANSGAGAVGIANAFSREDHVHPKSDVLTSLAYNAGTTTLTYTDEAGATTNIDLSALTTDIYVTGGSFSAATATLTLTDASGATPDVTVSFAGFVGTITDNGNGTYTYSTASGSTIIDIRDGVSADAGNALSPGSDNRAYLATSAIPSASSTMPAALGTAAVGVGTTFARADHVHALPQASAIATAAVPSLPVSGAALAVSNVQAVIEDLRDDVNVLQGPAQDYATTEQNLGTKWHDGTTIYRRVFTFSGQAVNVPFTLGTIGAAAKPVACGGWFGDGATKEFFGTLSGFGSETRVYMVGADAVMVIGVTGYDRGEVWLTYAR